MSNNFQKLFFSSELVEPPSELLTRIIKEVRVRQQFRLKVRLACRSLFFVLSAVVFVLGLGLIQKDLTATGFMHFISLLFSDSSIVLAYWQSFILALLESLPVTSLLVVLIAVLTAFESLKFLTKDIKVIFSSKQPIIH